MGKMNGTKPSATAKLILRRMAEASWSEKSLAEANGGYAKVICVQKPSMNDIYAKTSEKQATHARETVQCAT
jgi:hypothetical protein